MPEPPIEVPRHRPRYCLDNLDCAWLDLANQHRTAAALPRLTEDDLELIIDDFETQANSTIRQRCNNKKANTLEDNSVCDVCRSPHGEDGNELVFCDGCDICVHQHCYGINDLDQPKWFCRPCQVNAVITAPKSGQNSVALGEYQAKMLPLRPVWRRDDESDWLGEVGRVLGGALGPHPVCAVDTGSDDDQTGPNVRPRPIANTRIPPLSQMLRLSKPSRLRTGDYLNTFKARKKLPNFNFISSAT